MSKVSPSKQQIHKPLCPCGRKLPLVKEAPRGAQTQAGTAQGGRMGNDGQPWWHRGMQGSASLGKQQSHLGTP